MYPQNVNILPCLPYFSYLYVYIQFLFGPELNFARPKIVTLKTNALNSQDRNGVILAGKKIRFSVRL